MNILATCVHEPSAVLAIVDCKFISFFFFDFLKSLSYPCFIFVVVVCLFLSFFKVPAILWKAGRRLPHMLHHYLNHGSRSSTLQVFVPIVYFNRASNVQKAGRSLEAKYPCIHAQTCAAHLVSLFFLDICQKLWQVQLMLVNYCRLYCLFGSRSMHSPYDLFCHQSKVFNGGHKVGLLCASDTRMAGHAYAQVRM
jgi:hypothetical protein